VARYIHPNFALRFSQNSCAEQLDNSPVRAHPTSPLCPLFRSVIPGIHRAEISEFAHSGHVHPDLHQGCDPPSRPFFDTHAMKFRKQPLFLVVMQHLSVCVCGGGWGRGGAIISEVPTIPILRDGFSPAFRNLVSPQH